jgi:hypothetical protein
VAGLERQILAHHRRVFGKVGRGFFRHEYGVGCLASRLTAEFPAYCRGERIRRYCETG